MGPEEIRQLVASRGGVMEWEMLLQAIMPTVHPGQAWREAERVRVKQRSGETSPNVRKKLATRTELMIYGRRSKARDWAYNAVTRGKLVRVEEDGILYVMIPNREEPNGPVSSNL